jgi:hypothetical protein
MRIGSRMIRICGTGVDIGIPVKAHVKVASRRRAQAVMRCCHAFLN